MSNKDDCYFYYYSTCSKGNNCPFRHCEAALGNETVCVLWKEGRCFRSVCQFRHMEINKKRSEIPCYWEKQPLGCQKLNCAFHHTKGRFVDGLFLPPSKTAIPNAFEPPEEELKISVQQNKLSVQSNPSPQMRGVMKVDSSENVPSPAHPPVVINAADDDEDDDDQLSEENDEAKTPHQQSSPKGHNGLRVVPTRKTMTITKEDKGGSLNFGIKTLEEIKSKKMKEKSKQQPTCSFEIAAQTQAHPDQENENERAMVRTVTLSTNNGEQPKIRLTLAERLGKRIAPTVAETDLPMKRNLAERLGKKIDPLENADRTPKTVQVRTTVKERLGFPFGQNKIATENAATSEVELHMKTLEEVHVEKANQRKGTIQPKPKVIVSWTTDDSSPCTKPSPATRIKTFSEAFADRKQKQTEEQKQGSVVVTAPARITLEEPSGKDKDFGEVRIKTLEEIKREKALRMQQSVDSKKTQLQPERSPFGRRLLCITKPKATGKEEKPQLESTSFSRVSRTDTTVKLLNDSVSHSYPKVHVKSLEEIKKEKQCLKNQPERKPQEKEEAVAAAGGNAAEAKSLMLTNPAPPMKPSKTHLPTKRVLERSEEPVKKKMQLEESEVSSQTQNQRIKAKPNVNVKRSGVKPLPPSKHALKPKAPGIRPSVAAVKPLSLVPSAYAKQCSPATTALANPPEKTVVTIPETVCSNRSELHLGNQATSARQADIASPASSHEVVKTHIPSSTGPPKTPCAVEDEIDKLMWEISEGTLEDEIELDPGKDQDDLLLELSEMIDS
uniref:C3H1-type domain-containing protein n=1 Tax=Anolis carolinensis TaxID=28377 RepID=G1KZ30_ANOCA|nr:PREDICTED: zinc finger CCCH domain-containing protein 11A [Anolis carolinensis]XP_008107868.1 PREDICTED: zinc finger CCCH domain-containing protein 11A [Anolis carolinensis]XP_008107869.1 PREDICTED: zinc finger CCCH domain-containing protein 11A [Anolis carolinensis]XP_008107870.1 PREDICTED: zinc finger CCCH domain-containing protein 11A [Anolis carolinensis]XP_008107871.1 PREDICTED: zinc finger CCCH domain-containing protein 11A [Anolis carolinensis]XP_008107872.1 PREDICTED: zinc finger CC|eukprot:XP_008107867.1 PREDICTED: zinc finger CCCH domain-containing protein 11A [Anolis carolinensis]